jgi:iron complex outermembrane recepter protein
MRQAANLLAIVAAFTLADSAQAGTRNRVDIKAGELGDAIVQLGQQTGSSIGITDPRITRMSVRALRGQMSVEDALRKLLTGRPASVIRINGNSWRIVPAMPAAKKRVLAKRAKPAAVRSISHTTLPAETEEIIVTASKRETPFSKLPATVTVISGNAFANGPDAGGTAAILEKLPSVSSTHAGSGRNKLFIRGIADSGFTGPTQATVGQYFGEMRVNYNAPDPDLRLYDIQSVEVMEGPQGTLYGAGSLGGIIRTNPNLPNMIETQGYTAYTVASTAHGGESIDGQAVVNVPVVLDKIAIRLLGYGAHEGGYIDDVGRDLKDINDVDTLGGRAAISLMAHEDWRIDIIGVGQSIRSDDAQYAQRGLPGLSRRSPMQQKSGSDYWLANLEVAGELGTIGLVSSIGYVNHDLVENYDATRLRDSPTLFTQQNRISLFSTEHRLSQEFDDGGGWLLGASFTRSVSRLKRKLNSPSLSAFQTGVENSSSEWSLFGEATVGILPNVHATAGGRLSSARLTGSAFDVPAFFDVASLRQNASRKETTFLPSVAVTVTPGSNLTGFFRFQQGFRPGGLAIDGSDIRQFRNDKMSTIESGFRFGDLGRDHISAMATIAYTDWQNIQADLTDGQGFPTTANIGDGHILSVEGQLSVQPFPQLTFDGAFIFSKSRLDSPSATARSFLMATAQQRLARVLSVPNVANFNGRAAITFRHDMADGSDVIIAASTRYVGKSRLGIGPVLGTEQGGYLQSNLGFKWERRQSDLFVNVTNLFDAIGNRYALGTPFALPDGDEYTPLRPRTVMIGFNLAL